MEDPERPSTDALRVRRRRPLSTNDQTLVPPRRPAVDDPLRSDARVHSCRSRP